jgi:hypothetical protein
MVTESQANAVIEECTAIAPLPDGYTMEVDRKTHNILVCGPNLGFCITEKAMTERRYVESFAPCLEALIEAEADFLKDPTNPCWHLKKPMTIERGRQQQ